MTNRNGGDWQFNQAPHIVQAGYEYPYSAPQPRVQQFDWNDPNAQRAFGWPNSRRENLIPGNSYDSLQRSGYHHNHDQWQPMPYWLADTKVGRIGIVVMWILLLFPIVAFALPVIFS